MREQLKDANPRMRVQAIRASETLYKAGNRTFADDYRALTKDSDPDVAVQALLTSNLFRLPNIEAFITETQAANQLEGSAGDRQTAAPADRECREDGGARLQP